MTNLSLKDWLIVGFPSLIFIMFFLGDTRMLSIPDEGRYASIAVEMVRTGDWLVPRLNGVQYLYKPPMFYWLNAISITLFDNVIFASRIIPAMLGWLTILFTFFVSARLYNRSVGYCSAYFLTLSFLWYIGGRAINLDLAVAAFMVWGLYFYVLAHLEKRQTGLRYFYIYGMYTSLALAVLTKGFIGLILPGAVFFIHIICARNWHSLLRLKLISGTILFLIIILPWHILMNQANPEWFDFYIVREHFLRFFTSVHDRTAPWWYYGPILALGLMPFAPFFVTAFTQIQTAWQRKHYNFGLELVLWIWVLFIFVFFSVSSSKLPLYILPIVPVITILSGYIMVQFIHGHYRKHVLKSTFVYMLMCSGLGMFLIVVPEIPSLVPETDAEYLAESMQDLGITLKIFGAFLVIHSVSLFLCCTYKKQLAGVIVTGILFVPVSITTNIMAQGVNEKSSFPLLTRLVEIRKPTEEIVLSRFIEDIPAYLNENVSIVEYGGESSYFMEYEDITDRYYETDEFEKRWQGEKRMFFIAHRKDVDEYLGKMKRFEIYKDKMYSLYINK